MGRIITNPRDPDYLYELDDDWTEDDIEFDEYYEYEGDPDRERDEYYDMLDMKKEWGE